EGGVFFFSSRRRHTRSYGDWSSDVCSSDLCGHDWAPLSRGKLEGHVVVCPRHFARYDVRTGQLLSGPLADDVPVYEVRIEEDTRSEERRVGKGCRRQGARGEYVTAMSHYRN